MAAPVGPTPTVLPMGAPVPRPRGPPPPPGDENREVRLQGSSWEQESVLEGDYFWIFREGLERRWENFWGWDWLVEGIHVYLKHT